MLQSFSKPVTARDIALQSFRHAFQIEETLVKSLIDVTNGGIREHACQGLLHYECVVPAFIYGWPRFDRAYVARKLRHAYRQQGFRVTGHRETVRITWERAIPP